MRVQQHQQHQSSSSASSSRRFGGSSGSKNKQQQQTSAAVVGTEAVAHENIRKNAKLMKYPEPGFVTPIEHSLLYAMLNAQDIFPENVVKQQIQQEDFRLYLPVKYEKKITETTDDDDPYHPDYCSYAQLSAILAVAAEKWPAGKEEKQQQSQWHEGDEDEQAGNSYRDKDDDASPTSFSDRIDNSTPQTSSRKPPPPRTFSDNSSSQSSNRDKKKSVPQVLCKILLQFVIKYSELYDLDREHEVQELLSPVEKFFIQKDNKTLTKQILPIYVGYGAAILTGNPLPILIGAGMANAWTMKEVVNDVQEKTNLRDLSTATNRMASAETTGLLDEVNDDDDNDD